MIVDMNSPVVDRAPLSCLRAMVAVIVTLLALLGGVANAEPGTDRFAPLPPEMLTPEQKAVPIVKKALDAGEYNPKGFDAILLRNVGLQDAINLVSSKVYPVAAKLYFGLDNPATTPPGLMEMGILMLSHHWDFQPMFTSHGPLALKFGISQEIIDALAQGQRPANMKPDEAAIYDFCDELIRNRVVNDPTFAEARRYLSERDLVDLLVTLGVYSTSLMILKVADIDRH